MIGGEAVFRHDLRPTKDELIRFTSGALAKTKPMRVQIQFSPRLVRRLGDIVPTFEVPGGFRLAEYMSYLNTDCELRVEVLRDEDGKPDGVVIEVSKANLGVYKVFGVYI